MYGGGVIILFFTSLLMISSTLYFLYGRKLSAGKQIVIWGLLSIILISPIIAILAGMTAPYFSDDTWADLGFTVRAFVYSEIVSFVVLVIGIVQVMRGK